MAIQPGDSSTSTSDVSTGSYPKPKLPHQYEPSHDVADQSRALKRRKTTETPSPSHQSANGLIQVPNQRTFLVKLPPEILKNIAELMPPSTAACLTLTCKLALAVLGTQWLTNYRDLVSGNKRNHPAAQAHHNVFLKPLCRDLRPSDYEMCVPCASLHSPIKPPTEHRETRLTRFCQGHYIDYLPRTPDNGYNLLLGHVASAFEQKAFDAKFAVSHLARKFQAQHGQVQYTLSTSADWISGKLILRHEHQFGPFLGPTCLDDYLRTYPRRVCPHQSTASAPAPDGHVNPRACNLPAFKRSIQAGFAGPGPFACKVPSSGTVTTRPPHMPPIRFMKPRSPTALEREQMKTICLPFFGCEKCPMTYSSKCERAPPSSFSFACDKCPTKWRVAREDKDQWDLDQTYTVTSFHYFGRDFNTASHYFPWFVRRSGTEVSFNEANDEWQSPRSSFADFKAVENEVLMDRFGRWKMRS
ncbi:uncharacterized protein PG986_005047 [Apiospora aurea]|uniref:F-box domain-containing protein n=1 Tax=Apiospora aurea TaxID=335848 RepID=A0ABR1QGQ8_9PEZI